MKVDRKDWATRVFISGLSRGDPGVVTAQDAQTALEACALPEGAAVKVEPGRILKTEAVRLGVDAAVVDHLVDLAEGNLRSPIQAAPPPSAGRAQVPFFDFDSLQLIREHRFDRRSGARVELADGRGNTLTLSAGPKNQAQCLATFQPRSGGTKMEVDLAKDSALAYQVATAIASMLTRTAFRPDASAGPRQIDRAVVDGFADAMPYPRRGACEQTAALREQYRFDALEPLSIYQADPKTFLASYRAGELRVDLLFGCSDEIGLHDPKVLAEKKLPAAFIRYRADTEAGPVDSGFRWMSKGEMAELEEGLVQKSTINDVRWRAPLTKSFLQDLCALLVGASAESLTEAQGSDASARIRSR